jgi:hypothetical protein
VIGVYTGYYDHIHLIVNWIEESMDIQHITAHNVKVYQGGSLGTSGVKKGAYHDDSMHNAESEKENVGPSSNNKNTLCH